MGIKIGIQKTVEVEASVLKVCAKVRDCFGATLVDQDGQRIGEEYDGYVPGFFPGDHGGDYMELDIELATGKILNWTPPTAEQIEAFANGNE